MLDINPAQADLRLGPAVAAAWHERLTMTSVGQPRKDRHGVLITVRAFYRDIGQWALEDPGRWARWAAPAPVRDGDVRSMRKIRRQRQARMQQRTRVLTPLLPRLVATAEGRRHHSARLLAAASDTPHGDHVMVDGVVCVRDDPPPRGGAWNERSRVWIRDASGARPDPTALEIDCFWAWALIETLRLTGARIEEVLEQPVHLTPHDFRRLFTTDVIGAGLPLHIAAAPLGHIDLDTTRGYTAVFQDQLIARHQQFITGRRALRDSAEYRDVTPDEWAEFEKHFQLRRGRARRNRRPRRDPPPHPPQRTQLSTSSQQPAEVIIRIAEPRL